MSSEQTEHVNGTAPAAPAELSGEITTAGERILGALALVVAIGVALIAIDLISGGRAWDQFLPMRASRPEQDS